MDITGIGSIADLAKGIIDKIWPDKTQQQKDEMAQAMLLLQGAMNQAQGQMDINKVEAASGSVFVSGWRPFIGWVCGIGCAWNWIGLPIANAIANGFHHPLALAPMNAGEIMPLLMGMLGMGALRTYEKVQNVASK